MRPLAWLGTLSTVVAVATGMFTLRDQILPSDAGNAMASTASYEQSIGQVCNALNQIASAQPDDAAELARQLSAATTPLTQRDAVLSSWKQALGDSQQELAAFQGLDPPGQLVARQRTTDQAWNVMVTHVRGFVEQLEATTSGSGLHALLRTLPALNASLAGESLTRSAGLTNLGGGHCVLSPPLATPVVTLPGTPQFVLGPSGNVGKARRSRTVDKTQPTPPVTPTVEPSVPVTPPQALTRPAGPQRPTPTAPVKATTQLTAPLNPPLFDRGRPHLHLSAVTARG